MVLEVVIGLGKLKREKIMAGKFLVGEEQTILEHQSDLNGNQGLQKQFNIGFPQ